MIFYYIVLMMAASGSTHAWDFKLPKELDSVFKLPKDIDSVPQLAERTFFNYTTLASTGNLAVINKTTTALAAGVILASTFLAGTMIYTLEENRSSSAKLSNRVDGFLSDFFSSQFSSDDYDEDESDTAMSRSEGGKKKGRKRRKKKVDSEPVCNDCETYCYNKYYYGDPYHSYETPSADGSTYSKRYVESSCEGAAQSQKAKKNRLSVLFNRLKALFHPSSLLSTTMQ